MTPPAQRDHGGNLDAAIRAYGGARSDWLDLSTGVNPVPFPLPDLDAACWANLPERDALNSLNAAARRHWNVPTRAGALAAPGASSLIARIPLLASPGAVEIPQPTYNEHRAAFEHCGWRIGPAGARVIVHPNNPDGRIWQRDEALAGDPALLIIDESFCDVTPEHTLIGLAARPRTLILKSFGKFWGLAGLRLGFAFGDPDLIGILAEMLGPWPVSGPAIKIGRAALGDADWPVSTRARLIADSQRMDRMMTGQGAMVLGGTSLFRLYQVDDAKAWQTKLARHRIWTRIFPYSDTWLRLGVPHPERFDQLGHALGSS